MIPEPVEASSTDAELVRSVAADLSVPRADPADSFVLHAPLELLRDTLADCIGCGCLSLRNCALYNPDDGAAALGTGPRYLLGDSSDDVVGP